MSFLQKLRTEDVIYLHLPAAEIFFLSTKINYIYIYIKEVPEVLITELVTINMVPQSGSISLIGNQNMGRKNTCDLIPMPPLLLQKIMFEITGPLIEMDSKILLQIMNPGPH